jgi:hypothetical protein
LYFDTLFILGTVGTPKVTPRKLLEWMKRETNNKNKQTLLQIELGFQEKEEEWRHLEK